MILPPQSFGVRVHNLKRKRIKPSPHCVELDGVQLVNTLETTLSIIANSVKKILVVFHNPNVLVDNGRQAQRYM